MHANHFVHFFAGDDSLTGAAAEFLGRGLHLGQACISIATASHRRSIDRHLQRAGFDVAALTAAYDYIPVDANSLLAEFFHRPAMNECRTNDAWLDRARFFDRAGLLLTQAASTGKPVRLFGEMVALLAEQGHVEAVLELEEMCNELGRLHEVNMFCAYPLRVMANPSFENLAHQISSMHLHVPSGDLH